MYHVEHDGGLAFFVSRLRADVNLRRDIETARAFGVSPRRFWGWEPKQVTSYEYDESGQMIRSVTRTEAEWDDVQHALAFAVQQIEDETCAGCGQPTGEAYSPLADPSNHGKQWAYKAVSKRCHGCTAMAKKQEKLKDAAYGAALRFPVEKIELRKKGQ